MCNTGSPGQHTGFRVMCTSNYTRSGAYCAEDSTVSSGDLHEDSPTLTLLHTPTFPYISFIYMDIQSHPL